MAKKYVKPAVVFQTLSMGTDVSSGCTMDITFIEFYCPILIPEWGETVFTEYNCDWSNDDYYVCYHIPTAGTNVFGS